MLEFLIQSLKFTKSYIIEYLYSWQQCWFNYGRVRRESGVL